MQFKDIIGQLEVKKQLVQEVAEDRIPHAQLLTGPAGNGKLAMAYAFGQYLNCTNRKDGDSCGECSSCRKFSKLIHPDLHMIYPVVKSDKFKEPTSTDYIDKWRPFFLENRYPAFEKWMNLIADENKQGSIYVYEAREIIRKLNQKAFESGYKVAIVWLPEQMNAECANKLLKMIEEPPARTVFLLVAEDEEQIISTIRSRCQVVRIPRIADHDLEAGLATHPSIGTQNPATVARLARGNFIYALELLENDELRASNHENFTKLMRLAYSRKGNSELLKWTDEVSRIGRVKQKSFLQYCSEYLRENFVLNMKEPELVYMDDQQSDFSARFAPFIHERNVIPLFQEFEQAYRDISMNGNARIIFLDLALKVAIFLRS